MSRLVARILLSVFVLPLGGLLYTVAFVVLDEQRFGRGYHEAAFIAFLASGGLTWAGIAVYWVLLWRTSVRWTAKRVWRTVIAAGLATVVGAIGGRQPAGRSRRGTTRTLPHWSAAC